MPRTRISTREIGNGEVKKEDLNITLPNQAVIQQILAGVGISLDFTGVDEGTGIVTISATENLSFSYIIVKELIQIMKEQQMYISGETCIEGPDGELDIEGELVIGL